MISGSCLCRAVKYEITGVIHDFVHCHCHTCRKVHGTVYGSSAIVDSLDFVVTEGESELTAFESSPGKDRCFCRRCGSHVFARIQSRPQEIILRIGTLDQDPNVAPEAHIWMSHRASWCEIGDDLPLHEKGKKGTGEVD